MGHYQNRSAEYNIILRKSLEAALGMLGENGTRILMAELQYRGGYLLDIQHELSFEKIRHALKNAFGEDVAQALMEEIFLRMDEIWEKSHPAEPNLFG